MDKESNPGLAERLLTEQLNWYSIQRHDFLNHWQVILGYLQLKQVDKASSYMKEALNLETEQQAGQIADPLVAAVVLGLIHRLRLEGFVAKLMIPERFKVPEFWQTFAVKKYAEVLYGYTTECLKLSHANTSANLKREEGMIQALIDFEDEFGESFVFSLYQEQAGVAEEVCLAERTFSIDWNVEL